MIVDLILVTLGAVGAAYTLSHKTPASWRVGDGFIPRLLRCSFCTGVHSGGWFGVVAMALRCADGEPLPTGHYFLPMAMACFALGIGVLTLLLQNVLNAVILLEDVVEVRE